MLTGKCSERVIDGFTQLKVVTRKMEEARITYWKQTKK